MKVALVGGSPSSDSLAPFDNPEWEIWVHGNQMDRHTNRRVTRIFEIHDDLTEHDPKYARWLVSLNIPLVVGEQFPGKTDHVERYPFEQAESILGGHLTSTPAYMMAYAMIHGATHIGIYGVDMAVDDNEYFRQRPSMYAWIAYAKAKGVEITIPEASPLFRDQYIEGRDHGQSGPFSEAEFLKMADQHRQKVEELRSQINTHHGSQQTYERLAKVARAVEAGQDMKSLSDSAVIR